MTLDSATWAVLALLLTASGAVYTYVAWRRNGAAAGVRGLAWTLVPVTPANQGGQPGALDRAVQTIAGNGQPLSADRKSVV